MIAALLLTLILVTAMAPETVLARLVHRWLVVPLATALNRIRPGHVMIAVAILALIGIALFLGGGDGLRMLAMAAPDAAAALMTFEVTSYLDAIAAIALAASTMRLTAMRRQISSIAMAWFRRPIARGARRRRIRDKPTGTAANDDDDGVAGRALRIAA